MSTDARKKEIERIREAGRQARFKGVHRQNCPHGTLDRLQWLVGWDAADREMARYENKGALA